MGCPCRTHINTHLGPMWVLYFLLAGGDTDQTPQDLRRRILRRLIWVYTVWQLPFCGVITVASSMVIYTEVKRKRGVNFCSDFKQFIRCFLPTFKGDRTCC